ncbi:MAG: hypothetical protein AB7T06_14525, partial [Kofleriaceae bacterium]
VRLVGDRATERDAQLGAKLGLDQAVGTERFLGIVVTEICFASSGGDPDGSEGSGAAAGLRDREILDRRAEALANQRHRRKGDQSIVVVIGPTEDRACH